MSCSPARLALALVCLVSAVGVGSCGRPHMVLNSALDELHNVPLGDEVPERLTLPELQWMLSNNEITPVQVDDVPRSRMDLVRRDNTATAKPHNCMNYFWKSRTAC